MSRSKEYRSNHDKGIEGFKWLTNFDRSAYPLYIELIRKYQYRYNHTGFKIVKDAYDKHKRRLKDMYGFYISDTIDTRHIWNLFRETSDDKRKFLRSLSDFITEQEMEL
jgi:hypothetical protein